MATRAYNSETRLREQAERKGRIAAAAAALHAEKGANATSYAEIAAEAKVSLPTVYAHFPTQRELLQGCTAHVAARAPALPVEKVLAATDLPAAAELLMDAVLQRHLHFEPWLAWREDRVIPFLAEMSAGVRDEMAALIARSAEAASRTGRAPRGGRGLGIRAVVRLLASPRPRSPAVASRGQARDRSMPARNRRFEGRIPSRPHLKEKAMMSSAVASIDEIAPETYRINVALPDAMPGGFSFNQYLVVDEMPLHLPHGAEEAVPAHPGANRNRAPDLEASLHRLLARRVGRVREPLRVPARRSRVAAGLQRGCGDGLGQRSRRCRASGHGRRAGAEPRSAPGGVAIDAAFAARLGMRLPLRHDDWDALLRRPFHATGCGPPAARRRRHPHSKRDVPHGRWITTRIRVETTKLIDKLASLAPARLACMHGSAWQGDGAAMLRTLGASLARG